MSVDSADTSSAVVVVQRWHRYGHDRAYVRRGDVQLGYRDLRTGDVTCADDGNAELIAQATAGILQRAQRTRTPDYSPKHRAPDAPEAPDAEDAEDAEDAADPAHAADASTSSPTPPERATPQLCDRDMAQNVPGQAARERARYTSAAAPARSLLARALGRRPDEHPWSTGAEGEELVGRYLAALGPDWYALHAVPVGDRGSDIDHVVIGPAGVFTVNDKNHPKAAVWVRDNAIKVNGFNVQYVRNSRFEASRAANLLTAAAGFDVTVLGLVAVVGAGLRLTVKEQPSDGCVVVIGGEDLVDYLHNLPAVLGTPSVERIYSRARHLATWQPTVAWSDFE